MNARMQECKHFSRYMNFTKLNKFKILSKLVFRCYADFTESVDKKKITIMLHVPPEA